MPPPGSKHRVLRGAFEPDGGVDSQCSHPDTLVSADRTDRTGPQRRTTPPQQVTSRGLPTEPPTVGSRWEPGWEVQWEGQQRPIGEGEWTTSSRRWTRISPALWMASGTNTASSIGSPTTLRMCTWRPGDRPTFRSCRTGSMTTTPEQNGLACGRRPSRIRRRARVCGSPQRERATSWDSGSADQHGTMAATSSKRSGWRADNRRSRAIAGPAQSRVSGDGGAGRPGAAPA